jgi:hypothetical protein
MREIILAFLMESNYNVQIPDSLLELGVEQEKVLNP